ncbi:MAG TPA: hypothetical protein DEP87_00480, partial [Candidatus Pacebacteria bacterium]|nr:hypothetical protein [Candidatus Paceibacterota bacterium]
QLLIHKDGILEVPKIISKTKGRLELEYISGLNLEAQLIELFETNVKKTTKIWINYYDLLTKIAASPTATDLRNFSSYFNAQDHSLKWLPNYYYDLMLSNIISNKGAKYFVDFESWFDFAVPLKMVIARALWQQLIDLQSLIIKSGITGFPLVKIADELYCPEDWLKSLEISPGELIEYVNLNHKFYTKILKPGFKIEPIQASKNSDLKLNLNLTQLEDFLEAPQYTDQKLIEILEKTKLELAEKETQLNQIYSGRIWKLLLKYYAFRDRLKI